MSNNQYHVEPYCCHCCCLSRAKWRELIRTEWNETIRCETKSWAMSSRDICLILPFHSLAICHSDSKKCNTIKSPNGIATFKAFFSFKSQKFFLHSSLKIELRWKNASESVQSEETPEIKIQEQSTAFLHPVLLVDTYQISFDLNQRNFSRYFSVVATRKNFRQKPKNI